MAKKKSKELRAAMLTREIKERLGIVAVGRGQPFLIQVVRAIHFLPREGWDDLSEDLQAWSNAATLACNNDTQLPELGDDVPPAAAAPFLSHPSPVQTKEQDERGKFQQT